ncbi:MAG: outer membrane beta-barrel protein [Bacteroidales bacterium]|nr:outer membrane beta-barrel protein [Bacteroidales bacterium]
MRIYILYILFFSFLFINSDVKSQSHYRFQDHWNTSFFVGTTNFSGDVSDNANSFKDNNPFSKYFYQDRRFGLGIYLDKMFNPYFGMRGLFMYASMKSTKESEKIYFTGNLFEYSLSGVFDLTNTFLGIDKRREYQVYAFLGLGLTETKSELFNLVNDTLINREGYTVEKEGRGAKRLTELVMPIGIGARYIINKSFSVFGEFTTHIVFSNKIDAYPVEGTVTERLGMINVGVTYYFRLPSHWSFGRGNIRYNGKSSDPSIRAFNKRKRVVMQTKAHKKAMKKRKKYGRKRSRKNRW